MEIEMKIFSPNSHEWLIKVSKNLARYRFVKIILLNRQNT